MSHAVPIASVTVLEDRASVSRRGAIAVVAGQQRIVIDRVAPVLVDKTITAAATGARVLDIRCERYTAPWREPSSDEVPAQLRAERAALEATRADAETRARVATAESEALAGVIATAWEDLAVGATRGALAAASESAAPLAELADQDRAARTRAADAALDAQLAAAALARLDRRLARAEAEAGPLAARLVIDVVAEAAGEAQLDVGYVVPCAAWRPYHRAELARDSERVAWTTTACVWQATGEDWPDCKLTFSLERASLGVDPPDLADDELRSRRKPETVAVEMRDQDVQTTGLGGGTAEVPGIDDGGLGLVLASERAVSVRSDGTPHRVSIGSFASAAQLALVAIPSVSPWVHVRARLANTGAIPLLAGPVDLIMASGYVGRGEVGFVATGERVDLGFGPEADVRAHRDEDRERDDAGILGGWNTQTVRVAVRVSNLGTRRREVVVTERVPVSEIEQVEIATSPADAYKIDDAGATQVFARAIDDRGLVTWTVELPPGARRVVTLEYKIKSRKDVSGV